MLLILLVSRLCMRRSSFTWSACLMHMNSMCAGRPGIASAMELGFMSVIRCLITLSSSSLANSIMPRTFCFNVGGRGSKSYEKKWRVVICEICVCVFHKRVFLKIWFQSFEVSGMKINNVTSPERVASTYNHNSGATVCNGLHYWSRKQKNDNKTTLLDMKTIQLQLIRIQWKQSLEQTQVYW